MMGCSVQSYIVVIIIRTFGTTLVVYVNGNVHNVITDVYIIVKDTRN